MFRNELILFNDDEALAETVADVAKAGNKKEGDDFGENEGRPERLEEELRRVC
jgi:hypothetical protein